MLSCRFYAKKCPELGDIVVCKPFRITDLCAYVHLLEYDNLEAMLTIGELSRRRIRSVNKLLRIGKIEYLEVIRVNEETRCVDLSKSSVSEEDAERCKNVYARARTINSILYRVAEALDYANKNDFEELYRKTAWHLDGRRGKTSSLDVFIAAMSDGSKLDELDIDDGTRSVLLESIKHKFGTKSCKIGAVIEVTCFEKEGIDAIKEALLAGKSLGTEEMPININLIAPPSFKISVSTLDKQKGIETLNAAIDVIKRKIIEYKGDMKIVTAPKLVTDKEEQELLSKMAELELQNREKSGDEDSADGSSSGESADAEDNDHLI